MTIKVNLPQLGESVVEATVGKWLVAEGDFVEKDQPVVEILTDKADSEVPAPEAGVVAKILLAEDETVPVGTTLFEIDTSGAAPTASKSQTSPSAEKKPAPPSPKPETKPAAAPKASSKSSPAPASPYVRKVAREQGIDLGSIAQNTQSKRIDLNDLTPKSATVAQSTTSPAKKSAFKVPPYVPHENDEVVPFSRRRRIIADHMVYSKQTSPDVVTFAECDLHQTSKLRDEHKARFKKEGTGLTFLAFAIQATCRALKEIPEMNARVLDDAYVKLGQVNLGVAVDTPDGLVVPVIHNADDLTIKGLSRAIDDIARRARNGNLTPDDLAGKTFTISNPGRKGNLVGGAIISQPNVGILRMGTIVKRVVVVEKDGEDLMAIHPVMHMALTYDHRIVDGVQANGFLHRITEILETADFDI